MAENSAALLGGFLRLLIEFFKRPTPQPESPPTPARSRGQEPRAPTAPAGPRGIQESLIAAGLLDPPADGNIGPLTRWAMGEANPVPLNPGDDLAGRIVRAMQRRGHWIARHPDCFNIVYVEGLDPDGTPNDNAPNRFNDLRLLIRIIDGVPKIVAAWDATTEPSRRWTERPMNPKGAARIAFGQYKAWAVGMHHDHEALVQVTTVTVYRDANKDYRRDGDERDTGLFGINQHWGYDLPRNDLGNSSAGCLVGRSTAGHREFMRLVKSDKRHVVSNGKYRFITTVMPASAL